MRPFIFDFKRSFLRISTLLFLIVFALAGIGIAYAIDQGIGNAVDIKYSVIGYSEVDGNHLIVTAMTIGPNGDPASGVKVSVLNSNNTEMASGTTNSSGEISFNLPIQRKIVPLALVVYQENGLNISESLYLHNETFYYSSPYTNEPFFIPGANINSFSSFLVSNYFPNGSVKLYVSTLLPVSLYYNVTDKVSLSGIQEFGNFSLKHSHFIANQSLGIRSYMINVRNHPSTLFFYFLAKPINSTQYTNSITKSEVTSGSPISIDELTGFESSFSLYAEFFPIIFLYLAYSLLAKPRGTGALEFLLSKPITREEIFINRFLGGAITAFVSSGVFMIILSIALLSITGTFVGILPTIYIFIGLSLSLLAFYSLMFLIGGAVKSSGTFLGLSIFAYVFFTFIEPPLFFVLDLDGIHILKYEDYFSFTAPLAFMENLAEKSLSSIFTSFYYNAPLEVIDVALWIFVPVIIGYILFTRLLEKRKLIKNK
jgi:ABC-2 type transport system permease protein